MAKAPKPDSLDMYTPDGSSMVEIYSMKCADDGRLALDLKVLGSMRMEAIMTPEGIAQGWPVVMKNKGEIIKFAKKIPAALKARKKAAKQG